MSKQDWRPLPEDVTTHTMAAFFEHDPERLCMYHSRLGAWTFDGFNECLREGHPDPWSRSAPTTAAGDDDEGVGADE